MRTINNWEPETRSLLERLIAAGFTIIGGNNGEDEFKFRGSLGPLINELTATDESHLYVKPPHSDKVLWLFLVYGNDPGELVADYSVSTDSEVDDPLDAPTQAHYDAWMGKKQPTKEVE